MGGESVSLLVCDDHRVLADALAALLDGDRRIRLVAPPVHRGEDAVELCARHRPDVALMDIELAGDIDGIEGTRRIRAASPETKVVILSGHDRRDKLLDAVEAGACGYLTKTAAAGDVVGVVLAAAAGEVLVEPRLLTDLLSDRARLRNERTEVESRLRALTPREREVLALLAEGRRTEQIASQLFISPRTAQTHIQRILTKLGVRSRLEAVAFAVAPPGGSAGTDPPT